MKPRPRMLLWIALGKRLPPGHEQQGERPALLVGVPGCLGRPRFPMLLVAPVTSFQGQAWASEAPRLYPRLSAGVAGLPHDSIVLLDQLQSVDANRVSRYLGELSEEEYRPVAAGLSLLTH